MLKTSLLKKYIYTFFDKGIKIQIFFFKKNKEGAMGIS